MPNPLRTLRYSLRPLRSKKDLTAKYAKGCAKHRTPPFLIELNRKNGFLEVPTRLTPTRPAQSAWLPQRGRGRKRVYHLWAEA